MVTILSILIINRLYANKKGIKDKINKHMKKLSLGLVMVLAFAMLAGFNVAKAQNTDSDVSATYSYRADASVRPVGFFDKVKLFFTFNAEKKAELLSDFSDRNFELAKEKISEGRSEEASVLFQKSDEDILRASDSTSRIRDEEKQKEILNNISNTAENRASVLAEVQMNVENTTAKEAIGRAIENQIEVRSNIDAKIQSLLNKIAELEAKIRELERSNNASGSVEGDINSTTTPDSNSGEKSNLATLIIVKDAIPNNAEDFKFTVKGVSGEPGVSGYLQSVILDDDTASVTPNTQTFQIVPGTYSISENQAQGWNTSWACTPGLEGGTDSGIGNTNTVDIGAGKTVKCVYTNKSTSGSLGTSTTPPSSTEQQGFISPTQGSSYALGNSLSVKIKTSPQWFHCSNGFYLYNSNNQEIGTVGILTEPGKTSYTWSDASKRYATCGTGVGEIPISVSAGSYKICLKETNTETGIGQNFYCSGLFTLTSNTNNVTDQPAYLIKAYSQNNKNYVEVDYIEVLSGAASIQAQVEDGECPNANDCYDFPNGYKRNQNPMIRTFEVANDSTININGLLLWKKVVPPLEATYANSQDPYWTSGDAFNYAMSTVNRNITFTEFKNLVSSVTSYLPYNPPFKKPITYIKIDVQNNIATKITEPYQE